MLKKLELFILFSNVAERILHDLLKGNAMLPMQCACLFQKEMTHNNSLCMYERQAVSASALSFPRLSMIAFVTVYHLSLEEASALHGKHGVAFQSSQRHLNKS